MYSDLLKPFGLSEPDIGQEVIILCKDNSCHVATWKGRDEHRGALWYVLGPAGAPRRLNKKVVWWMPRPQLPEEEFYAETCL